MYFEPPRREGSSPEYLALYRWLCQLTEQLNVAFAEKEERDKKGENHVSGK